MYVSRVVSIGNLQVSKNSREVICPRKGFIRLATVWAKAALYLSFGVECSALAKICESSLQFDEAFFDPLCSDGEGP